jgi:hypothetical protein
MAKLFQLDHLFIWADKDALEIELFRKNGFTSIISGNHFKQGTSGKYIFFLNFYIELLNISDSVEAYKNIETFGCNYIERSNWRLNNSSPFGLGIKMKPFNKNNILFDYTEYKAIWMRGTGLLMADNNKNLFDPLVFVLYPNMEFPCYNSIDDMLIDDKPDDFKKNHIHENGIKSLTSYKIYINSEVEQSKIFDSLFKNGIEILKSNENMVELVFDNEINNKKIDFRPILPLIIKF